MIAILLLDIQTNKFIAFPNSHHLRTNFLNYKGPGPQIQMSRKITAFNTQVKFEAGTISFMVPGLIKLHICDFCTGP